MSLPSAHTRSLTHADTALASKGGSGVSIGAMDRRSMSQNDIQSIGTPGPGPASPPDRMHSATAVRVTWVSDEAEDSELSRPLSSTPVQESEDKPSHECDANATDISSIRTKQPSNAASPFRMLLRFGALSLLLVTVFAGARSFYSVSHLHRDTVRLGSTQIPQTTQLSSTTLFEPPAPSRRLYSVDVPHNLNPALQPLFAPVYYVYDLTAFNMELVREYSDWSGGVLPIHDEQRERLSNMQEIFFERHLAHGMRQSCSDGPASSSSADGVEWHPRFTRDPTKATHFFIPAFLGLPMMAFSHHSQELALKLLEHLARPIEYVPEAGAESETEPTSQGEDEPSPIRTESVHPGGHAAFTFATKSSTSTGAPATRTVESPFIRLDGRQHTMISGHWYLEKVLGLASFRHVASWDANPNDPPQPLRAPALLHFQHVTFGTTELGWLQRTRYQMMSAYNALVKEEGMDEAKLKSLLTSPYSGRDITPTTDAFRNLLTLPYVAHRSTSEYSTRSLVSLHQKGRAYSKRKYLFFLKCSVYPDRVQHKSRRLIDQAFRTSPILNRTHSMIQVAEEEVLTASGAYSSGSSYASLLLSSDFCLQPPGDTPSTRRLFDSILLACIPVIISDRLVLPFSSVLKWDAFTIRLSQAKLLAGDISELEELVRMTADRKHELRMNLLRVRNHFDYNTPPRRRGQPDAVHGSELAQAVGLATWSEVDSTPTDESPDPLLHALYTSSQLSTLYHEPYTQLRDLPNYSPIDLALLEHPTLQPHTEDLR